jgi:hypothetical protein
MGWDVVMVIVMNDVVSFSAVLIMIHRHGARIRRGYAVGFCFTHGRRGSGLGLASRNAGCFVQKKWLIGGIPNIHSWIKSQGGIILF